MRRWFFYSLIVGVLGLLFYPFYLQLQQVREKQKAQNAFEERVQQSLGGSGGATEWRWRKNRERFLSSSKAPRGSTPPENTFLETFQFIRGGLPRRAPNFTATDLDRKSRSLSELRGNWVLLNFWASWCPSCRQEMPSLNRLWKTFRSRNFVLLGMNVQESQSVAREFARTYDLTFPIVLDRDGRIATKYRVTGIPETVLIDPEGRVLGKSIGYRLWDKPEARTFFEKVLEKP